MSGQNTQHAARSTQHAPNLTHLLTRFRRQVERDAGQPIETLDLNAALLLSDLCRFMGLPDEGCDRVLGARAVAFVGQVETQQISPRLSPESLVA